jgi:hypothetical protein
MLILRTSFVLVALMTLTPIALSQEGEAKQVLLKTLEELANSTVSLTGKVNEEQVSKEPPQIAQMIVVATMDRFITNDFQGDFEVLAAKDEVVLVSKSEFPGVKIHVASEKTICLQAHADEPYGVKSLIGRVQRLVNWSELAQAVQKSEKVLVTKVGNDTSLRVTLDNDFIRVESIEKELAKKMGDATLMNRMIGEPSIMPEVIDLTATFVIDSSNELKSAEFAAQYNDPMKVFRRQAERNAAGNRLRSNTAEAKNDNEVEFGKLITYSFERSSNPSERMVEFVKYCRELGTNKD